MTLEASPVEPAPSIKKAYDELTTIGQPKTEAPADPVPPKTPGPVGTDGLTETPKTDTTPTPKPKPKTNTTTTETPVTETPVVTPPPVEVDEFGNPITGASRYNLAEIRRRIAERNRTTRGGTLQTTSRGVKAALLGSTTKAAGGSTSSTNSGMIGESTMLGGKKV